MFAMAVSEHDWLPQSRQECSRRRQLTGTVSADSTDRTVHDPIAE